MAGGYDPERDFAEYQKAISSWGNPKQINELMIWATPDQWRAIQKECATPEQLLEDIKRARKLGAVASAIGTVWTWTADAMRAIAAVGVGLAALRGLWEWLSR